MDKTLTLLFKFRMERQENDLSINFIHNNEIFFSSIFKLICDLEKSFPALQINKQEIINLGKELSNTLDGTLENDEAINEDEEVLFSIPIKLNQLELNNIKPKYEPRSEAAKSYISNDLQWIELIESKVINEIIKSGKTWKAISEDLNISQKKLRYRIKKILGYSLIEFQNKIQFELASKMLVNGEKLAIAEIAQRVGFRDSRYFSKKFKNYYGVLPSEYKNHFC